MIDENSQKRLKNLASYASISVSILLTVIKALAALYTGSLSIISSMVDSLADLFSSAISLVAVRFSNMPPNSEHRYGYGKAESLSALLQAAFIAGSAGFILYDGFNRLIHPIEIKQTGIGIAVMVICFVVTFVLVAFQRYVIKKTNSLAISADSAHYYVDLLTNASIIMSVFVVKYLHWAWFDIATAIFIAIYLIFNAYDLVCEALAEITDKEIDGEIKSQIVELINSVDGGKGFHDFRSRVSGARFFLEVHLELDGNKPLFVTHDISSVVQKKIEDKFPLAQVIIHQDPFGIEENRLDHVIEGN